MVVEFSCHNEGKGPMTSSAGISPLGPWRRHRWRTFGVAGFSYVDLILVLLLMAVMLAAALPAWSRTVARMRLQSTAERLAWHLRLLQAEAISQGTTGSVQFVPGENAYSLSLVKDPRTGEPPLQVNISDAARGVELSNTTFPADSLSFGPTGLPSTSGVVTLTSGPWSVQVIVRANGAITVQTTVFAPVAEGATTL